MTDVDVFFIALMAGSAIVVIPAAIGVWIGFRIIDRSK